MLKKTASLIGATVVATGLMTAGATTPAHAYVDGCYTASKTTTTHKLRCSTGYGTFQFGTYCNKGDIGYFQWGNVANRTATSLNAASAVVCAAGYTVDNDVYIRGRN